LLGPGRQGPLAPEDPHKERNVALRLPARIRGVGLGLAVLAAAPIVAAALTTSAPGHIVASGPLRTHLASVQAVRDVPNVPTRELRLHAPFPPPPPPAPSPKPARKPGIFVPAASWPHTAVVAIIVAAAQRWGVDPNFLLRIAECESGMRPTAINRSGPYYGLFQFLMSTFVHNGGTNIWDPTDQANIAAKMIAHGQAHQWSCA
jgi:soluble lytic murein transglycosylase-like protein